jgi:hypothetical protein
MGHCCARRAHDTGTREGFVGTGTQTRLTGRLVDVGIRGRVVSVADGASDGHGT